MPSLLSVDGLTMKYSHTSGLNTWCPAGIALWGGFENMGRLSLGPLNILSFAFSCPFLSLLPVGRHGQSLCHTPLSVTKNQAEPLCLLHHGGLMS